MIIETSKDSIIDALKSDLHRYVIEIAEIQSGGVAFWCDEDSGILVNRCIAYKFSHHDNISYEINTSSASFTEECLHLISSKNHNYFRLFVNDKRDRSNANEALFTSLLPQYAFSFVKNTASYILLEDPPFLVIPSDKIIELTPAHKPLAEAFFHHEEEKTRPPFFKLYDIFVLQEPSLSQQIYAYIENERIIGYLACCCEQDNIYDVDYVYVLPDERNKGIGYELVKYYIYAIRKIGGLLRYGAAATPYSQKLAEKAGFSQITYLSQYEFIKRIVD